MHFRQSLTIYRVHCLTAYVSREFRKKKKEDPELFLPLLKYLSLDIAEQVWCSTQDG